MAFKLTKKEAEQHEELAANLTTLLGKLGDEINVYNEAVEALKKPVEDALEAYNNAANEAREFKEDIASQADADITEKSEKWQEGDRGVAAIAWKDAWNDLTIDEIQIEWPNELTVDDPDQIDAFENAPEAADEV